MAYSRQLDLEGFCAPFERRVGELPLGKFLGKHVPRWTNSTKDNFPLYKFQKGQVPNGRGVVWGKFVQGELVC